MSSISASGKSFKLALIQLAVGANKSANLSRAVEKVEEAAKKGAQVRKSFDACLKRFCSSGRSHLIKTNCVLNLELYHFRWYPCQNVLILHMELNTFPNMLSRSKVDQHVKHLKKQLKNTR